MTKVVSNVCPMRKSRSPHRDRNSIRNPSLGHNQRLIDNLKKENHSEQDDSTSENLHWPRMGKRDKGDQLTKEIIMRRPASASCDQSSTSWGKAVFIDRGFQPLAVGKASSDRKSGKTNFSDSLPPCNREKKFEFGRMKGRDHYQFLYHEGAEVVPFLLLAAQKQREIIQLLKYEKIGFRKKLMNEEERTKPGETYKFRYLTSCCDGTQSLKERHPCNFDASYANTLDDIFHSWINLIYFIINLRVNFLKLLNKSGKEPFVPNIAAEREILTRAVESVKTVSMLKVNTLSDALDRLRFVDDSRKSNIETIEIEDMISSPFIHEMEHLGKKAKEVVSRIKSINEKRVKT